LLFFVLDVMLALGEEIELLGPEEGGGGFPGSGRRDDVGALR